MRAKFKCEYRDLNFLESPVAYKQIQFDHIVPKHVAKLESFDNLAAVCRTCNIDWKSRWNPRTKASPGAGREELIAICRAYVNERRDKTTEEINRLLRIMGTAQPADA